MPRIKEYNPPAELLARLPKSGIVSKGDKLAALDALLHRADIHWRAARVKIFEAIRNDIRAAHRNPAHKDSAPAETRAPSRTEERIEQSASIPEKALERKIDDDISLKIENGYLALYHTDDGLLFFFTPDNADRLATALTELADDLRQDANARAWSQELLKATTE